MHPVDMLCVCCLSVCLSVVHFILACSIVVKINIYDISWRFGPAAIPYIVYRIPSTIGLLSDSYALVNDVIFLLIYKTIKFV